jgi:hypothetical protein
MLKDFFRNLLVDEDDFIEEDEEEEAVEEIKPEPIMHQQQPAAESAQEAPIFVEPEISVEEVVPEEKPAFKGIDVSELDDVTTRKKSDKTGYKYDRKKLSRSKPQRTSSEPAFYQAVLSPIFGNMEEEDKEFDKVHNAIDLPKVSDEDLNIQVISPMYGNDVPTSKPVSSIPAYTVPAASRAERTNEQVSRVSALDLSDALEEGEEGVVRESLFKEGNKK